MENMKIVTVLSIFMIFYSCNNMNNKNVKNDNTYDIVTLKEEDLPEIEYLRLEKMDFPFETNYSCVVYKDTLVIADTEYPSPYFISVYGLNSKQLLGQCYKKGNGPGEILSCSYVVRNGGFYVSDHYTGLISKFEVDTLLTLGKDYIPQIIHTAATISSNIDEFDDSTILGINEFYMEGYKECEQYPELLKIDMNTGRIIADSDVYSYSFFPGVVAGGQLFNLKEANQIMFAFFKKPCIKFYDRDLNIVKRIVGPENDDIEFDAQDITGGVNVVEYDDMRSQFYVQSYVYDDQIFLLNNRVYKYEFDRFINKSEVAKTQEIWLLDMKGDIKRRFKIENPESMIYSISYSGATKLLYAVSFDEDGETIFCRCVPVE